MVRQFSILLVFISFLFCSCERALDLGYIDTPPILVINSSFETNQDHGMDYIKLSVLKSVSLFSDDTIAFIDYADVAILKGNTDIEELELAYSDDGTPFYKTSFFPENGGTYKIVVDVEGFDQIVASGDFPAPQQWDSTSITNKTNDLSFKKKGFKKINFDVNVYFNDNPDDINFYQLKIFGRLENVHVDTNGNVTNVLDQNYQLLRMRNQQDNGLNSIINNDFDSNLVGAYFEDDTFNGKKNHRITFQVSCILKNTQSLKEIGVEFNAIGKEFYRYNQSIDELSKSFIGDNKSHSKSPYSSIKSENGYGVFGGINPQWKSVDF